MSSIKKWLDEKKFDWNNGIIVIHPTGDEYPGWSELKGDPITTASHQKEIEEIINIKFEDGFGVPMCPRFIARDLNAIYFPSQYDGATECEKIYISMYMYTKGEPIIETPYPGG